MKSVIKKSTLIGMQKEYTFLCEKSNLTDDDLDLIGFYEQTFDFIDMGEILISEDREVA